MGKHIIQYLKNCIKGAYLFTLVCIVLGIGSTILSVGAVSALMLPFMGVSMLTDVRYLIGIGGVLICTFITAPLGFKLFNFSIDYFYPKGARLYTYMEKEVEELFLGDVDDENDKYGTI